MLANQTHPVGQTVQEAGDTIIGTTRESTSVLVESFRDAWQQVAYYAPKLIAAIVILVIGYLVARLVARAITATCDRLGLQRGAERGGLVESMRQVGIQRSVPQIIGLIVFWFLMCVFLTAGFNVLGLEKVSAAMEKIVDYIPQILLATFMVVVGLLLAALLRGIIATSADRAGLGYAQQLASGVYYVVAVITLLVVLKHLGVNVQLINNLVLIVTAAIAVGFALAFGLGGRDVIGGILAGYYVRQRLQAGDHVQIAGLDGTVRDVGPVATIIETEEEGLVHRRSVPNTRMLNEAIR